MANLLHGYDRERFEFHVACLEKSGALLPHADDVAEWPADYPISRLYGVKTWRQQARFARHLRARPVDIVQAYGFYANCFAIPAARFAGVPTIIGSIRDVGASWTPMQRRVERTICRFADSVLTNAEAAKRRLIAEGYRREKIKVIANGIDIEQFERPRGPCLLRKDLGIPPDDPLVGVIARIDAVKGLEHFVDAVALLAGDFPDARFVIVGGSFPTDEHRAYHVALKKRIDSRGLAGKLILTGSRPDVPDILADLTLSVLPSLSEGLPNAVLESMAAGVPVIASDVGGIPEIIEDGVNGLLVPVADAERLATAMRQVMSDGEAAAKIAAAGKATVRARFSLQRMARLTEEHYLDLLSRVPRQSTSSGRGGETRLTAAKTRELN